MLGNKVSVDKSNTPAKAQKKQTSVQISASNRAEIFAGKAEFSRRDLRCVKMKGYPAGGSYF